MSEAAEELPKIRLIYTGARISSNHELDHYYVSDGLRQKFVFGRPLGKHTIIGTVIECEQTATGVRSPYRVIDYQGGTWEERNDWKNADYAAKQEDTARKRAKKDNKGTEAEVARLREMYMALPKSQRGMWLATLVYDITK